jgi:hypothetical protein
VSEILHTVKQTQIDKLNFQFTLGQISVPVFFEANCMLKKSTEENFIKFREIIKNINE